MTWEWYQKKIADFFRRVPGAVVSEDMKVRGKSGRQRQLDVLIRLPMKVQLGPAISVTVNIVIIVDAKRHERPLSIPMVGQINDLRDDVRAHLAIVTSPHGFTEGFRKRASLVNVVPLTITADLLAILARLEIPWAHSCLNDLCDSVRGCVDWRVPPNEGATVLGACQFCKVLHVLCPECASVFEVHEFDEGTPIRCPGCPRIYRAGRTFEGDMYVNVKDELDVLLMTAAYQNASKKVSASKVRKIINRTKWQYFEESPVINLTESDLMEWTESGSHLTLTERGIEEFKETILPVLEAE